MCHRISKVIQCSCFEIQCSGNMHSILPGQRSFSHSTIDRHFLHFFEQFETPRKNLSICDTSMSIKKKRKGIHSKGCKLNVTRLIG